MAEVKVGRVRIGWQGAWDNATAYNALDAVDYQGSSYVARQDVPAGTIPGTDPAYWALMAEKGDTGDKGDMPAYEWGDGTTQPTSALRFQNPDGTWGPWVDLEGPVGPQGPTGETPAHEWGDGTTAPTSSLRFENPDNSWGPWVDLKGPQGPEGPPGTADWADLQNKPQTAIRWPDTTEVVGLIDALAAKLDATAQATDSDKLDGYHATDFVLAADGAGGVPAGVICMWSGAITSIPSGWALCDGLNGTPDLRGRFIVGAGNAYAVGDTGGAYGVRLTENEIPSHSHTMQSAGAHAHTGSTSSSGYHSHSGSTSTNGYHNHNLVIAPYGGDHNTMGIRDDNSGAVGVRAHSNYIHASGNHSHSLSINGNGWHTHSLSTDSGGAHTHTIDAAGGGAAHENRPPYYALAYIMKL